MKAWRTASGTTSVLIDPCRKNFRSSGDHFGTWAVSIPITFFWSARLLWLAITAPNTATKTATPRGNLQGFIAGNFMNPCGTCKVRCAERVASRAGPALLDLHQNRGILFVNVMERLVEEKVERTDDDEKQGCGAIKMGTQPLPSRN